MISAVPELAAVASDPIGLCRAMCDVPSVSGNERALADGIERALAAAPWLQVTRDGDTVVARTDLGRAERVIIAGHLDTVPVNNNLPTELRADADGDWIWGRGTVDMKGGAAVQLHLALGIPEPAYDVTWIWYDHEEVEAKKNGLGRIARNHPELMRGEFAILCEPTSAGIEGGCNGTISSELRVRGRRAHSARAWLGVNAIHALAPALARLTDFQAETVAVDGLLFRESLSAVGVSGGVARNVIPDDATLQINYRFAPNKTVAEAEGILRGLFADYGLTVLDAAEGARPGLTHSVAAAFVTSLGVAPRAKLGWTDVARFSALGIPAVNFGPGNPELAHADDERVRVSEIRDCAAALRRWLLRR